MNATQQKTNPAHPLAKLRLMQLVSPALPIGAFTYSQGLEWAVENSWVHDTDTLQNWLQGLAQDNLAQLDIPILARLYHACKAEDEIALLYWSHTLLAARETSELRLEEQNRARALTTLLQSLEIEQATAWQDALQLCQATPYALAAVQWEIPLEDAALGYAWGWLENQVAAAIKLIPLGQTAGQQVELNLSEILPQAVETGLQLEEDQIGASAPAMALASSLHETQYTRLFRS